MTDATLQRSYLWDSIRKIWLTRNMRAQSDPWFLDYLLRIGKGTDVAPGFKDKTRYTLYVSPGSQISHIATNNGNIKRQYLIHNVLVKEI